jgi:superfamily I DNA/RNA helicase
VDLTEQQQAVVDHIVSGTNCTISARAGTGKSSTIVAAVNQLAQTRPGTSGYIVTYNATPAREMQPKLPPGFRSRTMHSIAYQAIGNQFRARLNPTNGTPIIAPWAAGEYMTLPKKLAVVTDTGESTITGHAIATCVLRTIKHWCYTPDPTITPGHVRLPHSINKDQNPELVDLVVTTARKIWEEDCINPHPTGQRLPYDHEWYLKLWATGLLEGNRWIGTDTLYIDEGQDSNQLVHALFTQQLALGVRGAVIGDPYQAIYGWRGARNIMGALTKNGLPQLLLTQSWRFGQTVADEGCKWLQLCGGEADLTGNPAIVSSLGPIDPNQPYTVLCRTNAGCATEVVAAVAAGQRTGIAGNLAQVVPVLKAASHLKAGRRSEHPLIAAFPSWEKLREYAESDECDQQELTLTVRLLDDRNGWDVIRILEQAAHTKNPHVTVVTAHSVKGAQWGQVRIGGDWKRPQPDPKTGQVIIPRETANLGYVAVTRAQHQLDIGDKETGLAWIDEHV